jgi:flagellar hook-associated protein 3 FlgL
MRVTELTFYNNFIQNQQADLNALTNVQEQISTGKKIQNIYDNPVIYSHYLKFNEEINTFTQVKKSASFALNFSRETDTTMNDMVNTLMDFKTKLISAANATNNDTSREAIVSELQSDLDHLKDLANTSLDGKYIFSGSAFNTKPINDEYQYQGNGDKVKAFLGAGVEREYNIDGKSLFLGRDNDYSKQITLNVPQYDKMQEYPQYVVMGSDGKLYIDKNVKQDGQTPYQDIPSKKVPITADSQIRMLTGVGDKYLGDGKYEDGTSYFYVRGRRSDGTTFEKVLKLDNSQKVSDLLDEIGKLYGNTSASKAVDVTINNQGEIQIKDLKTGNLDTDFYMAASDTYNPNESFEQNLKDIVTNGDYFVEFQKSGYKSVPEFSSAKANNSYFDPTVYKFGVDFKTINTHENAIPQDEIKTVLGDVNLSVTINGTSYSVDSSQTFQDLLNKINAAGYQASMQNGEIVIVDPNSTSLNQDDITIKTTDSSGNPVDALSAKDSLNMDRLYFQKKGNELTGNYIQTTKNNTYYYQNGEKIFKRMDESVATDDTRIMDVDGSDSVPQTFEINYTDINGNTKSATITLNDDAVTFSVDGNTYHVYENNGDYTPAHDKITTEDTIDPETCKLCQTTKVDKGFTYKQLGDVVSMLMSDKLPAKDDFQDYENAVKEAREKVDAGINDEGKFYIKDKTSQDTKAEFSLYSDTGSFVLNANNSITIDSPKVNFFQTLQNAIEAVKNGNEYADASSDDPRNYGIQGAIQAIDHVMDHVRREHAKIGAVEQEFNMTIQRTDMLKVNVQTLQSQNVDTDLGSAIMKLNSLQTSYQALLASIAKVNNLTLLDYLR